MQQDDKVTASSLLTAPFTAGVSKAAASKYAQARTLVRKSAATPGFEERLQGSPMMGIHGGRPISPPPPGTHTPARYLHLSLRRGAHALTNHQQPNVGPSAHQWRHAGCISTCVLPVEQHRDDPRLSIAHPGPTRPTGGFKRWSKGGLSTTAADQRARHHQPQAKQETAQPPQGQRSP